MMRSLACSSAIALLLAGCSLAPDYLRPEVAPVPEAYKEMDGWKMAEPADAVERGAWWKVFKDDQLNALEDKVTSANQDLKAAVARYDQARALAAAAHAGYFPSLTGSASGVRQQVSANSLNSTSGALFNNYTAGVSAAYEIDIWGRVRNSVAAGERRAEASAADLAAMDLSLHAELAVDYFTLRGDDAAQAILDETIVAYQKAFELTQRRYQGGAAAAADVDQAQTQLENAKTQAADMHMKRQQLEHAIAVLTGQLPAAFNIAAAPLTATLPNLAVEMPSSLIERRPDIAAAERRTAAANADIGVARAAYFPTFNLAAMLGFESISTSNWFTAPSRFWSLGPSAALTIFDAGRISALSDEARAAYDESAANYRQTVLSAYQEVEDNLVALRQLEHENESQTKATAAAQRSLAQSKNRYVGGIVTYLDVVVAQTTALQAQLSSIDIMTRRMNASVGLVKALGGGWQDANDAPKKAISTPQIAPLTMPAQ